MELSDFGQIALQEWWKSFEMRSELFCDAFVIMPNHLHGIVRIDKIIGDGLPVETHGRASQQQQQQNHGVAYRSPKSVSSFVAGFKSSVTKKINECRGLPKNPVWQSRFHDHIIRNEIEFHSIKILSSIIQEIGKRIVFLNCDGSRVYLLAGTVIFIYW